MKVNVFGLGYVGNVTALKLADFGHDVTGIEVVQEKIDAINQGRLPIYEPGLKDLLKASKNGNFKGSFKVSSAIGNDFNDSDGSIVCVGTPNLITGEVDLSQLKGTLKTIGQALKGTSRWHSVIIRSTIPPGTTEEVLIPALQEESGKRAGEDFGVGFYPEFLREGSGLKDFERPSLNVLGYVNDKTKNFVKDVFTVDCELTSANIRTAELIKYVNNSYHALKVSFANEVGTLCRSYGVDSDELMEIFLRDTVLNVSPYYLRPGFAFGGACLPKELRAISSLLASKGLKGQLINSILPSNDEHKNRLISLIQAEDVKSVGFLGVTFKPDTDDTRESQIINVIMSLLKHPSYKDERKVYVCDRDFVIEKLEKDAGLGKVQFEKNPSKLFKEAELIVLGPYRLNESDIKELKQYKGVIVDLKWFVSLPEIKGLSNYRSFC